MSKKYALTLSPALLNNLVLVGCAILLKETVNLNKLKNHLAVLLDNKTSQTDSHYRRLTRFFHHPIAKRKLWKWLIMWMIDYIKQWDQRPMTCYLTLDGTSWQFGKTHIHRLVLSLIYRGVSLPLYWVNLAKKGHSSQCERIRLIQQANKLYPLKGMCILADREYVGKEWFKFLTDNGVQFIIRLTKQDYKHEISKGRRRYSSLLKSAMNNRLCGQWFELEQHRYQFVALHPDDAANTTDPLVLLLSNTDWRHRQIADRYRIRWHTACLFKHLKSNGFDMEELGMSSLPKIRLLVAILVVLYVLCVGEGFRQFHRIQGKYTYDPAKDFVAREAVFRRGYSIVARELANVVQFVDWLLTRLDRPLSVPKRIVWFTKKMNVQY